MTCATAAGPASDGEAGGLQNEYRIDISKKAQTFCSICKLRKPGNTKSENPRQLLQKSSEIGLPTSSNFLREEEMVETCRAQVLVARHTPHFLRKKHTSSDANPTFWTQRLFDDLAVATSMRSKKNNTDGTTTADSQGTQLQIFSGKTSCTDGTRSSARPTVLASCRTVNVDCSLPLVTSFRVKDTTKNERRS